MVSVVSPKLNVDFSAGNPPPQVNYLTYEEVLSSLNAISVLPTFKMRIQSLKKLCTKVGDSWDLWADWERGSLYVTLEPGAFRGHALGQEELGGHLDDEYLYLKIIETQQEQCEAKPLIECRLHLSGENAELLWIQKGVDEAFSYPTVCRIYRAFNEALKPRKVWLYDDAHKHVGKYKLSIRLISPLSGKVTKTFYHGLGFYTASLQGARGVLPEEVYTQNPGEYEEAVEGLRKLSITTLIKYMPAHMHLCQKVQEIYAQVKKKGFKGRQLSHLFTFLREDGSEKNLDLLCRALVHHKAETGYKDLKHITTWVTRLNEWRIYCSENKV